MPNTPNESTELSLSDALLYMMEYVLDAGKECECCMCRDWCKGITMGPNGPLFPPCSSKDFKDLLVATRIVEIYKEDHADA